MFLYDTKTVPPSLLLCAAPAVKCKQKDEVSYNVCWLPTYWKHFEILNLFILESDIFIDNNGALQQLFLNAILVFHLISVYYVFTI